MQTSRRNTLRCLAAAGTVAATSLAREVANAPTQIIDTNVSLFPWPFRRVPNDLPAALEHHLKKLGITEAWASTFEAVLHRDISAANQRLANACRNHPLFRPVGAINPTLPDWEQDLRTCREKHPVHAIRLLPGYHRYALTEPFVERVLQLAAAGNLLVQIAVTLEDVRTQHPALRAADVELNPLAGLVNSVPQVRVQLLNLRGRVPESLQKLDQVSFDTSRADSTDGVPTRIRETAPDRVLLGTHAPLLIPEASLIRLHESGRLDESQLEGVTSTNALRLVNREGVR